MLIWLTVNILLNFVYHICSTISNSCLWCAYKTVGRFTHKKHWPCDEPAVQLCADYTYVYQHLKHCHRFSQNWISDFLLSFARAGCLEKILRKPHGKTYCVVYRQLSIDNGDSWHVSIKGRHSLICCFDLV